MSDENERMIAALLRERSGARSDEHRAAIDEQLKLRGYEATPPEWPADDTKPAAEPRKRAPQGRSSKPGQRKAD